MTLNELIAFADGCYPDGLIHEYWTGRGEKPGVVRWNRKAGDTLALFIVAELKDTYDSELGTRKQCFEAANTLTSAAAQLLDLASDFRERAAQAYLNKEP